MIFSRILHFKIDPKSTKIRSWKLKFDFGGQKLAKMSILEAKKTILEAKKAVLEAKRAILEAKMEADHLGCCLFGEVGGMRTALSEARTRRIQPWSLEQSHTPAILSRMRRIFTLRACH